MKRFVFTCGDINGIGPEICIKAFNKIYSPSKYKLFLYIPAEIFKLAAKLIKPTFKYDITEKITDEIIVNKDITILDLGKAQRSVGSSTKISGEISFKAVRMAFEHVIRGNADALITAPLSKEALEKAGIKFSGHTEMLGELCRVKDPAMLFVSDKMIAALVTTHSSIKNLPELITKRKIYSTIKILQESLIKDFGINKPRIAVLALNPHAGEAGRMGLEEEVFIKPVIKNFHSNNIDGPFVPDAFFATKLYVNYDAVVGMYHDQILIPFKMLSFNKGVNFTAGLPIVRTSPDHGTAFDIAWKNQASPDSLIEAFKLADKITDARRKTK